MTPRESVAVVLATGLVLGGVAEILSDPPRPQPPWPSAAPARALDQAARSRPGAAPVETALNSGDAHDVAAAETSAPVADDAAAGTSAPVADDAAKAGRSTTEVDPGARLTPAGGCLGCGWELGGPAAQVLAPPERGRRGTWLGRHQGQDGSWSPSRPEDDPCWSRAGHRPGDARVAVGTTGLAILAFTGNGHTHRAGRSRRALNRALHWLQAQQAPDGSFVWGDAPEARWDHALATFALCELYAISQDPSLKTPATRAVAVCLGPVLDRVARSRDPVLGGWLLLALKAARVAELEVPDDAFTRLREAFPLDGSEDGALALLTHLLTGGSRRDPGVRETAEALATQELRWEPDQVDLRSWYVTTYALFQFGGRPWTSWHPQLLKVLSEHQHPLVHSVELWTCGVGAPAEPTPKPPMDCREGSWDPIGAWGMFHGRAGSSALASLCLQLHDRYERVQEQLRWAGSTAPPPGAR